MNWDDVYHRRLKPPYKPNVKDPTDTRYFDEEFTKMSPKDSVDSKGSLLTAKENKKYFKNFTFTDHEETLNVSPTIEDNSMNGDKL